MTHSDTNNIDATAPNGPQDPNANALDDVVEDAAADTTREEGDMPSTAGQADGGRLFTQDDVSRLIEKRLARQRQALLRDAARGDEAARAERDGLRAQRDALREELDAMRHHAGGIEAINRQLRLDASLIEAARAAGAIHPGQVAQLLRERATLDAEGAATICDGEATRPAAEAIQRFLADNPHLARPGARPGAGTQGAGTPAPTFTRQQVAEMTPEEFERHEARILEAARRGGVI